MYITFYVFTSLEKSVITALITGNDSSNALYDDVMNS